MYSAFFTSTSTLVAHKRNFGSWLVTMTAETFFRFLRGDLPPQVARARSSAPGGIGETALPAPSRLSTLNSKLSTFFHALRTQRCKGPVGHPPSDTSQDAALNQLIAAVSARFDRECARTFERTAGVTQEFSAADMEIILTCYPLEAITSWETKTSEALGWTETTDADPIVRLGCVISLPSPLGSPLVRARVTYTGGYVVPPGVPAAGQHALPKDLESAAIEQVGFLMQRRNALGLSRTGPSTVDYVQVRDLDLTPGVRAVLRRYRRYP